MTMYISSNDIRYENYEKMADDIHLVGFLAILRINVKMNKNLADGTKMHFHQEYVFNDSNNNAAVSVRRSFDYYLTLEMIKPDEFGNRESIMITLSDFIGFKNLIEGALKWFTDDQYKDLYMYRNKKLVITGHPDPLITSVICGNKWIRAEPIIINKYEHDEPGVCLSLNSDTVFTTMDIPNVMAISALLSTYNMFHSAQEMLSYFQKPAEPKRMDFRDATLVKSGKTGRFIGEVNKKIKEN